MQGSTDHNTKQLIDFRETREGVKRFRLIELVLSQCHYLFTLWLCSLTGARRPCWTLANSINYRNLIPFPVSSFSLRMSFTRNGNIASTITFLTFLYTITIQRTHTYWLSSGCYSVLFLQSLSPRMNAFLLNSPEISTLWRSRISRLLKDRNWTTTHLANNSQSTHTHNYTYMVFLFRIWHSLNTFRGYNWPFLATYLSNTNNFHCALSPLHCIPIPLQLNLQVSRRNRIFWFSMEMQATRLIHNTGTTGETLIWHGARDSCA